MKVNKIKGNIFNWFSHFIINQFWNCPECNSKDLKIKSEINTTWCIHCNKYIR